MSKLTILVVAWYPKGQTISYWEDAYLFPLKQSFPITVKSKRVQKDAIDQHEITQINNFFTGQPHCPFCPKENSKVIIPA